MQAHDNPYGTGINEGIVTWRATEGAVLLDVRSVPEYHRGHIPGSINIPLNAIDTITEVVPDADTPLFVYCQTGVRSKLALPKLEQVGYAHATNIGGINDYAGEMERSSTPTNA